MFQSKEDEPVFGFIINQMQEKLEDAISEFQEKKEQIEDQFKAEIDENKILSEKIEVYKKKQTKQESDLRELERNVKKLEEDFTNIKNFIKQRPTQSDQNKWTYRTISSLASDLFNKVQKEKKNQKDLYYQLIDDPEFYKTKKK